MLRGDAATSLELVGDVPIPYVTVNLIRCLHNDIHLAKNPLSKLSNLLRVLIRQMLVYACKRFSVALSVAGICGATASQPCGRPG